MSKAITLHKEISTILYDKLNLELIGKELLELKKFWNGGNVIIVTIETKSGKLVNSDFVYAMTNLESENAHI